MWRSCLGNFLIETLPASPVCNLIKKFVLTCRGAKIGKRVFIYPGVYIDRPDKLTIGDDAVLSRDVLIMTSGTVHIGARVLIGYGAKLLSADHVVPPAGQPIRFSGHTLAAIIIHDDAWVCANCIITKGTEVGSGAVIAAGAVVTQNVPADAIAAGVPAKVIKSRTTDGN